MKSLLVLARAVGLAAVLLGGTLSTALAAAPAESPVHVPDFVVRGIYPEFPERPWFYGKVGEFELVSDCPEREVKEYLEELQREYALLDYWLPPELRSAARIPYCIVLSRDSLPHSGMPFRFTGRSYSFGDAINAWHGTVSHVASGLDEVHRNPDWDVTRAYPGSRWTRYEMARAKFVAWRAYSAAHAALVRAGARYASWVDIMFHGASRVSGFDGHSVLVEGSGDRRRKSEVPPIDLRQLFALEGAARPVRKAESPREFFETTEWLGTWALYGDGGKHRDALWKLARAAAVPSANAEALFVDFFGLSIDEAEKQIEKFRRQLLPPQETREEPIRAEIPFQAALPAIEFRPATETDKARLIGEWCWDASRRYPKLAEALRQVGLRRVQRAARTERFDARVAGWQGMLEFASGDKAAARMWLEKSIKEGAAEPLFRFELARLILDETTAGTGTGSPTLDPAQADRAVNLLRDVWRERPDFVGVYELTLRAWQLVPPARDSELLREVVAAVAKFPREPKLIANTTLVCLRVAAWDEADRLIEAGMRSGAAGADSAFARLRETADAMRKAAAEQRASTP